MKTLLLVLLTVFASSAAQAEWELLVNTDDVDWYVDQSLTHKRGMIAKVWVLQEFKTAQPLYGGEYRSAKSQIQIRCDRRQWRNLYLSYYAGVSGEGENVYTHETAGSWIEVAAGEVSEAMYKVGCNPGKK